MNRGDRGMATVWSAAVVMIVLLVAMIAMAVAALVLARVKATTVADLAALAAVQGAGCADAMQVARANGLVLASCEGTDGDVTVRIEAPSPPALQRLTQWLGSPEPVVSAWARAGPG